MIHLRKVHAPLLVQVHQDKTQATNFVLPLSDLGGYKGLEATLADSSPPVQPAELPSDEPLASWTLVHPSMAQELDQWLVENTGCCLADGALRLLTPAEQECIQRDLDPDKKGMIVSMMQQAGDRVEVGRPTLPLL